MTKQKKLSRIATGLMMILWLAACRTDDRTNIPDVSDIDVKIEITRFEKLLLADSLISADSIRNLQQQYPAFADVYFNHVIPIPQDMLSSSDPELKMQEVRTWIRHPRTRWLYDTLTQIYPDLSFLEKDLTKAFKYAKYYFPEKETPRIFTTVSDFGYFPFIYAEDSLRDGIGISLEMFFGEKFPYREYNGLNNVFSDYLIRTYNRDHLVKRVLDVWVDDMVGPPAGNRLLDHMIHNGKKLYIISSLIPSASDTVIMDYSEPEMDWVKSNERNIWFQFTNQNMLYETSLNKIQKLIGPSPNSPGMPAEAPGNTGSWMGWRIVNAYMAKNPGTTLQQLVSLDDAQLLLDQSGYKPPRQ